MKRIIKPKAVIQFWLPPVVWAALIFFVSSKPVATTTEIYWEDFIVKKTAHLIEYGIFAILLFRALKNSGMDKKRAMFYSVILAFFYAATDEIHQAFIPGRQSRARDIIFDTIGAVAGVYLLWKLLPKAPPKLKNWAKKFHLN
jgi:hypothetical protein